MYEFTIKMCLDSKFMDFPYCEQFILRGFRRGGIWIDGKPAPAFHVLEAAMTFIDAK
jgi:hypothetical protein